MDTDNLKLIIKFLACFTGSVATKFVLPWTIVAGNPAQVVKERAIHD